MDRSFGLDFEAVMHHVDTAQTMSFFFPMLRRSLVVDMRQGPEDGPLVKVMPVARSAGDRLRSLKRLRPHMPRPREITSIPWPVYARTLVTSGVWERLLSRLAESGSEDAVRAAKGALVELMQAERQELAALIRGDQYETIWARHQ